MHICHLLLALDVNILLISRYGVQWRKWYRVCHMTKGLFYVVILMHAQGLCYLPLTHTLLPHVFLVIVLFAKGGMCLWITGHCGM